MLLNVMVKKAKKIFGKMFREKKEILDHLFFRKSHNILGQTFPWEKNIYIQKKVQIC